MKLIILNLIIFLFCINISLAQCIDETKIDSNAIVNFCDISFFEGYINSGYNPVCGCDGTTYANEECAQANGLTQWSDGPCGCFQPKNINVLQSIKIFSGFRNSPKYPVCGCDNKTYLDRNHAYFNGITNWENNGCKPCIDSNVIDLALDLTDCRSIADTNIFEFTIGGSIPGLRGCDGVFYPDICTAYYRHGVTKFYFLDECRPTMQPQPDFVCEDDYNPVCACGNIEYKNPCLAEKHFGMSNYYFGPCQCENPSIIGTFLGCQMVSQNENFDPVCSCDNKTYFNICEALNRFGSTENRFGPCKCIDSTFINQNLDCDNIFKPICGCDGYAYQNICEAIYKNGVIGHNTCKCTETDLIKPTVNCNETFDFDPVCGCDGRTYPNKCYAHYKVGITTLNITPGPCANTCKDSILTVPNFPCANQYEPVCGCDNVTYQNECIARYHFGVIKWKSGTCTSKTKDVASSIKINFFPNPTPNIVTIYCPDDIIFDYVEVMDTNGSKLLTKKVRLTNLGTINLSEIVKDGVYFIKLQSKLQTAILKVVLVK